MKVVMLLFLTLFFLKDASYAGNGSVDKRNISEQIYTEIGKLKDINSNLVLEVKNLRSGSNDQLKMIKELEDSSKQTNKIGFEGFVGILLGCVAVIVTVLGVGIAILTLWGYRNIKNAAIVAAVDASLKQLDKAIQTGKFNDSINAAIEYVTYRGIMSDKDFPEIDEEEK